MNLLAKLGEKFKKIKDDTKKRIMATIFAGGIALSGIGMTGCDNSADPNNTNPPIVNPGDNNGGTQNGGTQNPNYANYSQILQNVLTDSYYENLESADKSDNKIGSNRYTYNHPRFMALPYGFLEDEGFDIEAIKEKDLYAESGLYTIGNNLFIELRAEIKTDTPFWENTSSYLANYLLKYTLTDQELKEIHALHTSLSPFDKTTYSQAPWFVQELSYLKTPEVVSKQYITLDSIEAAESRCNEKEYVLPSNHLTYLGTYQIDDLYTEHKFQTHSYAGNRSSTKFDGNLYTLTFKTFGHGCTQYDSKNIRITTNAVGLQFPTENKQAAQASKTPITVMSSYYCLFKNVKDTSIEDVLTK